MPKYICSYAVDVPHYYDFTIEAKNRKEALIQARKALEAGHFEDFMGQECPENETAHRVFLHEGEAGEFAPSDTLDDVIRKATEWVSV